MSYALLGDFPLIQDEERRLRSEHQRRITELEAARGLCENVAALEGDARFKLWIVHVEALLRSAELELRNAKDHHALARAQGKVVALSSIVAVTRAAEAERKALAERLFEEHDLAARAGVTGDGPIHPSGGFWSDHGRQEQREAGQRRDAGDGPGTSGQHRP